MMTDGDVATVAGRMWDAHFNRYDAARSAWGRTWGGGDLSRVSAALRRCHSVRERRNGWSAFASGFDVSGCWRSRGDGADRRFLQGLQEIGWATDRNIQIDYRSVFELIKPASRKR